MQDVISLQGSNSSLIIDCANQAPQVVYWGEKLADGSLIDMMRLLRLRQEAPASPTEEVALTLSPTIGQGYAGQPAISLFGKAEQWSLSANVTEVITKSVNDYLITCIDSSRQLKVNHFIKMDEKTDVLSITTQIVNLADSVVQLDWCAAATLPIPSYVNTIMGFEGHWANEFNTHQLEQHFGCYVRENRRGRTSHDSFPGLLMHTPSTNQQTGEVYGFHLGWSGNHKIVAEKLADGRACVQMGELLLPGEIKLASNDSYTSPTLYASYSADGLSALSRQYQQFVRQHLIRQSIKDKPRPVHYNTWEGIYFDHDMTTLQDLADRAAQLGVERFVLDDGWFIGRNDDTAGLGDWFVDAQKYPDGLTPLIDHIRSLGMEFGLWFEPEMVNPNSQLFRQHPEWVLGTPPNPQLGFRNQLVLDLNREEVFSYLFDRIDALLTEYDIAYIKWDMNRDINHPGNAHGQPSIHQQTKAFYQLLAQLKQAHPKVEIESCASGGGRADYGVLAHADRIWTSDSNDALDRLNIQKGFSYFFPPELMGSHVGPRDCHITHRTLSMSMRASVTLFGHMGMEMDLRELSQDEKTELSAMVSLYKQHRQLVHSGDLHRLDLPDYLHGLGMVAKDKSEALFSCAYVGTNRASLPGSFYFAGLAAHSLYQLEIIWPLKLGEHWPKESIFQFKTNLQQIDKQQFTGELLMQLGLQLPLLTPQSSLIFHLTEVS